MDSLEVDLLNALAGVSQAEHHFLQLLREFDWRQGWKESGSTDCAAWMVWRCKISRGTAVEKVRVAKALWGLPKIDRAFAEGRLTYSQVRAVTRVATAVNEASLLDYALGCTADGLEQYCSRLRNADPAAAESLARRQLERRSLTTHEKQDGSGSLTVELPAAELQLVMAVLEQVGAGLVEDPDRSLFAKGADALVALARSYRVNSAEGSSTSSAGYEVVVHVDAAALSAGQTLSAESGYSSQDQYPGQYQHQYQHRPEHLNAEQTRGNKADLPLPVIRRLCCDGAVRALSHQDGNPLDVGRRQRTVPTALKRALQARDRVCRFPGCHHRQFIDAHHIQHWADGGATSLDNLILLCGHHHTLVHEGGYAIDRWRDGELFFKRPDGRPLEMAEGG